MQCPTRALFCGLLIGVALSAATIPVNTVNGIFMFGDSLSDVGNATILSNGQFPGPNYAQGRFTDGPDTTPATTGPQGLWIEQLAFTLHVPVPTPFANLTNPGTDYAVASAQTGTSNTQDVGNQLAAFSLGHLTGASSTALYAIWAGSDDILNGKSGATAADNIAGYVSTLSKNGAKYFIWPNLPPVGDTPFAVGSGQSAALNAQTIAFNQEWAKDILALQAQGIDVVGLDVNALFGRIASDNAAGCKPNASDPYCFANITSPAQGLAGIDPNTYLFWDPLHPTTEAHALVASAAYDSMVGVPEPAGLTAIGLVSVLAAWIIRSRRRYA